MQTQTDSLTITVSDSEIKKYYESHKKFYKQQASRDIEYVVFEVVPSAEDIAAANEDLLEVYDEFATTDNMKAFLMANSDRQYDAHWYAAGELNTLSTAINDFVFGKNNGVSEVFQNGNTFRAVRVIESANVPSLRSPAQVDGTQGFLPQPEKDWIVLL